MRKATPLPLFAATFALVACAAAGLVAASSVVLNTWTTYTARTVGLSTAESGNILLDGPAGVTQIVELPSAPPDGWTYTLRAVDTDVDVYPVGSDFLDAPGVTLYTITQGEAVTFCYHEGKGIWYIVGRN